MHVVLTTVVIGLLQNMQVKAIGVVLNIAGLTTPGFWLVIITAWGGPGFKAGLPYGWLMFFLKFSLII